MIYLEAKGTYYFVVNIKEEAFVGPVYTQSFEITDRIIVTDIMEVPTSGEVGVPLALRGTVLPEDASSQEIAWTIKDTGTTEVIIEGNKLFAQSEGTVTVQATIKDGKD